MSTMQWKYQKDYPVSATIWNKCVAKICLNKSKRRTKTQIANGSSKKLVYQFIILGVTSLAQRSFVGIFLIENFPYTKRLLETGSKSFRRSDTEPP